MTTPFTTAKKNVQPYPTAAQFTFLDRLMDTKNLTSIRPSYVNRAREVRNALENTRWITNADDRGAAVADYLNGEGLTRRGASTLIDTLKDLPSLASEVAPADELEDGFYTLEDQDGEGITRTYVYKVVTSQTSGRPYAKVLEGTTWEYAPGGVRALKLRNAPKLTLEVAQNLGQLYGVCVRCGAVLTDEDSIERGIGPVCMTKF